MGTPNQLNLMVSFGLEVDSRKGSHCLLLISRQIRRQLKQLLSQRVHRRLLCRRVFKGGGGGKGVCELHLIKGHWTLSSLQGGRN